MFLIYFYFALKYNKMNFIIYQNKINLVKKIKNIFKINKIG
jgi:hypothetical protein